MNYLIDTHIFLWWLDDDKRLSQRMREVIRDGKNSVFVSVVSAWEIAIKLKLNKGFKLKKPLDAYFKTSDFVVMDINLGHILRLTDLPLIHKDPFDRMLIAQAITEKMTLITVDANIKKYKVPTLD